MDYIESAINAAQQLMARHNLTREDIDDAQANPYAKVEMNQFRAFFYGKNRTAWELSLSHFVKEFIGTVEYYSTIARDLGGVRRLDELLKLELLT